MKVTVLTTSGHVFDFHDVEWVKNQDGVCLIKHKKDKQVVISEFPLVNVTKIDQKDLPK